METTWKFRRLEDASASVWDWESGCPDPRQLLSVRRPSASALSRHAPVRAHSLTTAGVLVLESGLEHDLVRRLDRDPDVVWLVGQPARLGLDNGSAHVPDLLSVARDGSVKLWDVRSLGEAVEEFWLVSRATKLACDEVGWGYEVFHGLEDVERLNLLWLHNFRRAPAWLESVRPEVLVLCGRQGPARLGDLLSLDDGRGFVRSVVWHLIWAGILLVDLTQPITPRCFVGLPEVVAP